MADTSGEAAARSVGTKVRALLAKPGPIGASGRLREAVRRLRAEAEADLADADRRLRAAADDRIAAAARIRACNRALLGTGTVRTADGETVLLSLRGSDRFDDPLPTHDLIPIGGTDLRDAVVGLLDLLDRPVAVGELVRLLAAHGWTPTGRASQAVSNALRRDVREGRVDRIARGRYRSVPTPSDPAPPGSTAAHATTPPTRT